MASCARGPSALSRCAARRAQCRSVGTHALPVSQLLDVALEAARAGGDVVMEAADKPRKVQFKGTTDLVTETDKNAEDAVLRVLSKRFPDHAVLGEEGGVSGNTKSEYLWCVDPLDGTTNFAHRYPSFAVSVGVLCRGRPAAAAVVAFGGGPRRWIATTYHASRGGGAFCDGEPIRVSSTDSLTNSLGVTGFGYEHDEAWMASHDLFRHFTDVTRGVRRLGAASVDLCHVAEGIVDAYWEYRLKPWDMAAGALIVEEAGGRLTTMNGVPFSVFDRSILATNAGVYDAILEQTRPSVENLRARGVDLSRWFIPAGYEGQLDLQ